MESLYDITRILFHFPSQFGVFSPLWYNFFSDNNFSFVEDPALVLLEAKTQDLCRRAKWRTYDGELVYWVYSWVQSKVFSIIFLCWKCTSLDDIRQWSIVLTGFSSSLRWVSCTWAPRVDYARRYHLTSSPQRRGPTTWCCRRGTRSVSFWGTTSSLNQINKPPFSSVLFYLLYLFFCFLSSFPV